MTTALAAAAATVMVAIIGIIGNRKRTSISGAQEITQAALALVTPQVTRIQALEKDLSECRTKRDRDLREGRRVSHQQRKRITQLERQLIEKGIDPVPPLPNEGESPWS